MPSVFHASPRSLRRALLILSLLAFAATIFLGGLAWLLLVPVLFALGRSYGSRAEPQPSGGHADYGVGAALAGFTPVIRK